MKELSSDTLTELRDLIMPSVRRVRHNFAPLLEEAFNLAIRAMKKPPEEWTRADALKICRLDIHLRDGLETEDHHPAVPIPGDLARALIELQTHLSALGHACDLQGGEVPVVGDMQGHLTRAQDLAATLLRNEGLAEDARDALNGLKLTLECADQNRRLRLSLLDEEREVALEAVGAPFSSGSREIACAAGWAVRRFPERVPDGLIFCDSPALWAPEMVVIPACPGGFLMGSPADEPDRDDDEAQHTVRIPRKIALARFALTFEAYDAYCREMGQEIPDDESWGRGRRPVINVSWGDASRWCDWFAEATSAAYRLPSEAEWEFACRGDASGTNTTPFCPWIARAGQGAYLTAEEANFDAFIDYNGSPKGQYRQMTVDVDHSDFRPNRFKLWQMHGNVDEWCADVFEGDYSRVPDDGVAFQPHPLPDGHARVLRGGSWNLNPRYLRSAYRNGGDPGSRISSVGFRPARTLFTP